MKELSRLVHRSFHIIPRQEDFRPLALGASGRTIVRIHFGGRTCIGIQWGNDRADNDSFIPAARHLHAHGVNVPEIYDYEPLGPGCVLCEAYDEEHLTDSKGKEDVRTVLRLHPALAPYKCAVLPLSKKLGEKAMEIRNELSKYFMVDYDDAGSIGKRYRREDEIGTPYCITVDFDTVGDEAKGIAADNCVTVRDRDTMEQVRMPISELKSYIESKIEF